MHIRIIALTTIVLALSFYQPAHAEQSRLESGYLLIPRIDIDGYGAFELLFRIDFNGEYLFVLEHAADPEPSTTSSGIYDVNTQTLIVDEIEADSGHLYSATLDLVSQSPVVVFRLNDAVLLYSPPGSTTQSNDEPISALNPAAEIDIQTTMQAAQLNCANSACHDVTPGTSRLNLDTGTMADFAARLVDQPSGSPACKNEKLIDSANPQNSLLLKLIDLNSGSQCISKMPFGQSGVSAANYAIFEDWVYQLIGTSAEQPQEETPEEIEPSYVQALDGFSALKRIKYLLHGGAVVDQDYLTALDSNGELEADGLETTISSWFGTPAFKRKMLSFLGVAFQQNDLGPIVPEYYQQLGGTWGHEYCTQRPEGLYTHDAMEVILTEMVPQTAYRLIDTDADFRTITTTNEIVTTSIGLFALALGDQQVPDNRVDTGHNICQFPDLSLEDFQDWRMVKLMPSNTPASFQGLNTNYVDTLRAIPDGGSFSLKANRNGICNSFSFFANWPTNISNQFRLNASQCMIASLGLIFEAGDSTTPNSLSGLDASHIDPETDCFGCHQHMDPMTNVFRGQYDLNHRLLETILSNNDADFAFHGHSKKVSTMDEFNMALSTHPKFAMGIALKLCQWATSQICSNDDPVLQAVVDDFADSGYRFKTLVLSLFSSPLLTTVNQSGEFAEIGSKISATRSQHMCLSLETRMEQQLATDRKETASPDTNVCQSDYYAMEATKSIPEDLFQRGYAEFIQASSINLITPKLHEPLCDSIRHPVMQAFEGYREDRSSQTLDSFTRFFVGLPMASESFTSARESLDKMYRIAQAPRCNSISALEDSLDNNQSCGFDMNHVKSMEFVFRNICLAPNTTAIGL